MIHPQLETFILVVESGSFSRAAQSRDCSAVSIMNQGDNLEARLGVKFLIRGSQGISLTAEGEFFYKEAKKLRNAAARIM